ncbi:DUF624 domain-containing protein [Alkalihalobacillus oceani]|uniref:DUF624 domain-containing protein n=1 Tax=Halalkalibacter oceani TaxID=1653776 RepID=A0A9X2IQJ9_9BACI|nr:DUF624 domain-containing protein [Halalkalibacter oceani]MCM3716390.1 DUF624 domain-containing protein [Halalkalibacter oceani]
MGRALYSILEWITRFAYLNVLWIFFTLTGGIVVGLFPATVAMFSVIRQWLKGKSDQPVFHTFWQLYKQEFRKSNRLGIIIYLISFIFIFNLFFLQANIGELLIWTSAPLLGGMLLFILILFYLFPAYAHFDLPVFQLIRNAFLTMLVSPLHTLFIILGLGGFYLLATVIPALAVVFGASFYSFITMWVALDAFQRIHKKNA